MLTPRSAGHIYHAFRNASGALGLKDHGEEDTLAICWIFNACMNPDNRYLGVRVLAAFQGQTLPSVFQ